MELRSNVIISIVLHVTIFTAALALAGRHVALHSPERFISVTLFEHSADRKNMATWTGEIKLPAKTRDKIFKGLRDTITPEVPVKAAKEYKEPSAGLRPKNISIQDDTGSREASLAADSGTAFMRKDGEVSETSADMNLPIPGEAGPLETTGDKNNKAAAEGADAVNAIRAAIERAKSYPPIARERGIGGTVTAAFTISATGHPENIRIIRSSGYEILDIAARKTLLRAAPLPRVDGTLEVPITFRIDR